MKESTIQSASLHDSNSTRDEQQALKRLKNDKDIVIIADKGRVAVVMNKTDYHDKIDALVNDKQTNKGTSETIARILQPYNIRVAHKPITTLRHLLTNVKDKDEPNNRQGAVYKIKCSDCQASYIGETGRNLKTRLTEHKRATRNGDVNNHIAEHHRLTNHTIDWDSAQCVTYSTNYFQPLTLESCFTNLEQTPLNRCQQLPSPYKRLIHDINITNEPNRTT